MDDKRSIRVWMYHINEDDTIHNTEITDESEFKKYARPKEDFNKHKTFKNPIAFFGSLNYIVIDRKRSKNIPIKYPWIYSALRPVIKIKGNVWTIFLCYYYWWSYMIFGGDLFYLTAIVFSYIVAVPWVVWYLTKKITKLIYEGFTLK